jgi:predicted MFS family arabinose efflux permease
MKTFTTSLDKFNKTTTIFVIILLLVIISVVFYLTPNSEQSIADSIMFLPIILCMVTYLFRPNNYSVSSDKLLIHRLINNVKIDRNNIQSVQEIDESQVKNSLRTFGVGGFFGNFGTFWNGKLGKMTWYVTRKNNFVLVETKDQKKIILTPDKPVEFVASFQ